MNIRVYDIVVADKHAKDVHVAFHLNHMHMRMARTDAAANDLEAGREHVDVSERPIGDAAAYSETRMHGGVDLAPERAEARRIVEVLNDHDSRKAFGLTIFIPVLAGGTGPRGGSLARIMPVRARPTIGGSFRSTHTIGSTVKPIARRSGATISRPLQIVGVSQALSASRSSAANW